MSALFPPIRAAATVIALAAWAGLAFQFDASLARTGALGPALWSMARYFTILTNLGLAVIFTAVAMGRSGFAAPRVLAGATLCILLVGVVYGLLLRGRAEHGGAAWTADLILHNVTPVLTLLFWLALAPKGKLSRNDPFVWALFPAAYFIYAVARGAWDGRYPYFFIDVATIGWGQTALNAVAIGVAFVAAGQGVVWLDGRLARRPGSNACPK